MKTGEVKTASAAFPCWICSSEVFFSERPFFFLFTMASASGQAESPGSEEDPSAPGSCPAGAFPETELVEAALVVAAASAPALSAHGPSRFVPGFPSGQLLSDISLESHELMYFSSRISKASINTGEVKTASAAFPCWICSSVVFFEERPFFFLVTMA